mmetsp:Transcript_59010/g.138263  ORF Transcript_59010/g.138263 Transcript_59010/m.138263 type:complete len:245 (+) Transcript_59010:757-1491(+)
MLAARANSGRCSWLNVCSKGYLDTCSLKLPARRAWASFRSCKAVLKRSSSPTMPSTAWITAVWRHNFVALHKSSSSGMIASKICWRVLILSPCWTLITMASSQSLSTSNASHVRMSINLDFPDLPHPKHSHQLLSSNSFTLVTCLWSPRTSAAKTNEVWDSMFTPLRLTTCSSNLPWHHTASNMVSCDIFRAEMQVGKTEAKTAKTQPNTVPIRAPVSAPWSRTSTGPRLKSVVSSGLMKHIVK